MAKFLLQKDLGAVALCLAVLFMFESFSEVGIRISVIQNKKGAQQAYLNASWWLQAGRGLILGFTGIFFSKWIADFYGDPRLASFLQVFFLSLIFNNLISPGVHLLEKELRFGKYLFVYQGSALLGTLVTICLILLTRNVWAVVIGYTLESLFRLVWSFLLCPFLPRLPIDKECVRELAAFARGMFGLPFLTLLAYQADIFFLGKMVPGEQVGMYSMALQIARLPRDLISQILGKLLLPLFSLKQDESDSLQAILMRVSRWLNLVLGPLTAFFIVCSVPILYVVLRPEFIEAADAFVFLCVVTFLRIQSFVISNLYFATNRLSVHRFFVILRLGILLLCIVPFIRMWGITGAALAVLTGEASGFLFQMLFLCRKISLSASTYWVSYIPGARGALGLILLVAGCVYLSSFCRYPLQVLLASGSFVFLIVLFIEFFRNREEGRIFLDRIGRAAW